MIALKGRVGGFTFLEIMVTTLILSILTAGVFFVVLISDKVYHMDTALLDLQQFTRRALDEMVEELRAADTIVIPAGLNSITFNGTLGSGINYFRDAQNKLIRQYPTGTFRTIAGHISALSFCWCHGANCSTCNSTSAGSELIQIQLTSTNTIRGRVISFPMKGQVKLRNE